MIAPAVEAAAVAALVKPGNTLQWILWLWSAIVGENRLGFRKSVLRAMWAILRCRTGALGWRSRTCPEHGEEILPNSCARRDCPGCVERRSFCWAAMVEDRLLACDYFHVVFTLSDKLLPYWRHNRALMADCLLDATSGTLKKLLASQQYMGGAPAMLGVLHTHGSALTLHPHVHMLVSSAGLSPDGALVRVKLPTSLVPYRVLRRSFQATFMALFVKRARSADFYLPKGTTGADLQKLIDELYAQPQRFWNAWVFYRTNPVRVIRYLARSVYGGPIRNDRIVSVDEHHVTFRYVDWRSREEGSEESPEMKLMTVDVAQFVERWSEHIADPGQKTVRYWGLLAPCAKDDLDRARALLGQAPTPAEKSETSGDAEPVERCRQCGAALVVRVLDPTKAVLSPAASAILRSRASPLTRDARCAN